MAIELTPYEARVIGCLLEKEVTTPELYPLTLNSLTTAANQKSNRDPVYSLTDAEVMDTVEQLKTKRMVSDVEGFGSRVTKYQHRFCNTEFGTLQFTDQQKGIICVLLLRGPQTPGELRTRTNRLCEFSDMKDVESALVSLIEKGYVAQLPREPGKRESRYTHLFGSDTPETTTFVAPSDAAVDSSLTARVDELEREVAELKALVNELLQ
ncbi:YceH family protein [Enterovibrio sp. 27052020O]|uniref:YceH family protein n=1 Tax=Enterovibrio sp. 27052020O TaxID=3241166 RepID=UPI00388F81B7